MTQIKKMNIVNAAIMHVFEFAFVFFLAHMAKFFAPPMVTLDRAIVLAWEHIISNPFDCLYWNPAFISIALLAYAIGWCIVLLSHEMNKRKRRNTEYGSARFSTNAVGFSKKMSYRYNKHISKKRVLNDPKSIIFSKDLRLGMDGRKTKINNNVLICGSSGSGKSRFYVSPNLLNANSSFVVTDPKGELLRAMGGFLQNQGYEIKVLNLKDPLHSDYYNPWAYITDDISLLKTVNCFIQNTESEKKGGDGFWTQASEQLTLSLVGYLRETLPIEEVNFDKIAKLLAMAAVSEEDERAKSPLDFLFDKHHEEHPNSMACSYYAEYKKAAGKTAKSILISMSTRFNRITVPAIRNLTQKDTLDLDKLGLRKTALFIVTPDSDATLDFLAGMLYFQTFNINYDIADMQPSGRLPIPLRCIMDEFANLAPIPDFSKKLATMRSRQISCEIILQSYSQLKAKYKDDYESIISNCNSKLNLGTDDQTTLDFWVKMLLGKETIEESSTSVLSKKGSGGVKKVSRDLMTADELALLPNDVCLVAFKGYRPFKEKKYDVTKHPRYKECGLYDSSLNFDISSLIVDSLPVSSEFDKKVNDILQQESLNTDFAKSEFLQGIINDFATAEVEEPSEAQAVDPDKLADTLNRTSPFDFFDDVPEEYRQLLTADSDEASSNIDDNSEEVFDQFEDNNFFKNP